jgi:LysR family glycine cleavage system transcriptional activator
MSYRLPPLNGLRAFEASARHLSFRRAADELCVTPGAVSQQVKSLEASIGVKLFRRLPRGLLLTAAGEDYLPSISRATRRTIRTLALC